MLTAKPCMTNRAPTGTNPPESPSIMLHAAMARTSTSCTPMNFKLLALVALLFLSNTYGSHHVVRRVGQELEPADSYIPNHYLQYPISIVQRRKLENNTDASLHHSEEGEEEELPSCNDVLLPETIQERCHHAKNCEGEYIMTTLLPLAFCNDPSTPSPLDSHPILLIFFPILFPISLILLTLLLFSLLGSTAENYFSPALEMISSEFHIPPPLAGVTLLALGNGAPDVSAVVNAIKMSASEGIPLSLGELTGGGMFVQSVVVGRIVFLGSSFAAGKKTINGEKVIGVTCREELIRDITMYAISAGYVYWMCSKGVIFYRHVVAMLLLYCGYVAVVIVFEIRRHYSNVVPGIERDTGGNKYVEGVDKVPLIHTTTTPSYDEEDQTVELSRRRQISSEVLLTVNPPPKQPDPPGIKQSTRVLRMMQKQQLRQQQRLFEKRKSLVVHNKPDPQDRSPAAHLERGTVEDRSWSLQLFSESLRELSEHLYKALYSDIWTNTKLSRFEWWCMLLESPFTVMRKLVTPIPCEEEYNRSLVAYSIFFSPLWISFYISTKLDDFDPFCIDHLDDTGYCFPSVCWPCCISFTIGCAVIKYFPKEDAAALSLRYSLPISLYGFLIAATWIDVISDQLVNVLEFIGVILRIPAPIMGMTVLAWGNSVGDYTTNGALAQRGLADMSMAACFAGPTFNLLVGLGCGLLTQKEALLSNDGLPISLMPSVQTGFVFLICNCVVTVFVGVWNKGVIPKMHGYIFWAAYLAYMTMSAQNMVM